MVDTIFCTSGAALKRAGANVSTAIATLTIGTDYAVEQWISDAESFINVASRQNFSDTYSTLNVDVKKILEETAACLTAIQCIIYDMGNYNSRTEAEDMINTLRDMANRNIAYLRDMKYTEDFIKKA